MVVNGRRKKKNGKRIITQQAARNCSMWDDTRLDFAAVPFSLSLSITMDEYRESYHRLDAGNQSFRDSFAATILLLIDDAHAAGWIWEVSANAKINA